MADHTLNALQAAVRAMEEVVLPAVDPTHPLAGEQARLVTRYLSLFAQRMPLLGERNRFELLHYAALARTLQADADSLSPAIAAALRQAGADSDVLLLDPAATVQAVQAAAEHLAGVISALVRTAPAAPAAQRQRIETEVLVASGRLLQMQRAWFLPQGWEPDPGAVPTLAAVLADCR